MMTYQEHKIIRKAARLSAENRLLNHLLPIQMDQRSRDKLRSLLTDGKLDDRFVELEIESVEDAAASIKTPLQIYAKALVHPPSFPEDGLSWSFKDYCLREFSARRHVRREKLTIRDAIKRFEDEEFALLLVLEGFQEESHELNSDLSHVIIVQDSLIELLKSDLSLIYSISHHRFEELVFELIERLGFKAELTARTRDGGCDVIAFSSDSLGITTKYVIEAKHYSKTQRVGVGVIRQLNTVRIREQAHHGIVVTSAFFTKDAIQENRVFYGLHLHDFEKLSDWIKKA